ncbi:YSIRK-type signal peptide-containing protein [Helcococcus ovis]|uniref:YSIRK-type signal peptide-containing protein n=5 Tax=Helcococcus ovis TaxID=72026 RepID=UPI002E7B9D5A|nr:YSIRK-type signal peptide-containing protein [Helcococcus ovis]WNZ00808.1 YSIRK-type signal peptide-containing protein [Helcococcus ovis]
MKGQNKNRIIRYSIRKLSIGVVSVVVGAFTILGVSNIYGADFSRGGVVYAAEENSEDGLTREELNKIKENIKSKIDKIDDARFSSVIDGIYSRINSAKNLDDLIDVVFDSIHKTALSTPPHDLINAFFDNTIYLTKSEEKKIIEQVLFNSRNENFLKKGIIKNILSSIISKNAKNARILKSIFDNASKVLLDKDGNYFSKSENILEAKTAKIKELINDKDFRNIEVDSLVRETPLLISKMEKENEAINKLKSEVNKMKNIEDIDRLNLRIKRAQNLEELKKYETEVDLIIGLEKLEYLSDDDMNHYRELLRKEIIKSTQEEAIKGMKVLLDNAIERNSDKKKIAEKISDLKYISESDKSFYINNVKTANGVDSANVALELANEKNTAAKAVKDYARKPTQSNFNDAYDLTSGKYPDLNEKLIDVASKIELGTNNFSEAWNKEDETERARQLEIIEYKEKAKKEIDGLKTITEHSKNLAKKLIDEASNKEDVDKIVAEAKILENRKMKEKAKKEIDGLKTITEHSKNLAKKLIDEASNKEDVDKIVAEAKRLEDRKLKERERLLKEAKEKEKRAKINKDLEGLSDAWKKEDLDGRKSQLDRIKPIQPEKPSVPWTPLTPATPIKPIKPITKVNPHLLTEESVKYVKGSMKDIVIKTDAEISSFVEVRVGGKVLDPSNYEVKDGSTMVTLKNSYLEKLPLGKYVIEVVSKETDKYYSAILKTTLTVVEDKVSDDKPQVEKPEVEQPQVEKPQPQQKPSENNQNPETGDLGVVTSVVTALAAGAALVATRKKDE